MAMHLIPEDTVSHKPAADCRCHPQTEIRRDPRYLRGRRRQVLVHRPIGPIPFRGLLPSHATAQPI